MKVSHEEFFREVAVRIHSSLDLAKAIEETFKYMKDFIPCEMLGMFFATEDKDNGVKVFSVARFGRQLFPEPSSPSEPMISFNPHETRILEAFDKWKGNPIKIANNGEFPDPLVKAFPEIRRYSIIKLAIGSQTVNDCSLVLAKRGRNIYTEEHLQLLLTVREPFTIAMSNALRYLELLRLKEKLVDENRAMKNDLEAIGGDQVIGADFGLRRVMEMVKTVARTSSPVLILGETGAGKEVVAKSIHLASPRKDEAFIKVQCGAMPDTLLDSELFGHEKGAFTGAAGIKKGRFERANRGTIFLDEIGELSLDAQVRLLRVLQEKEFERLGGQQTIRVDVRVIAATHRNLQEMVRRKAFREDLWFRLNVFPIEIPPLRARKEDILALVQHFIIRRSRELNLPVSPGLAPGTLDRLLAYDWPGNVRELQNVIERGLIISNGRPIEIPATYFPVPERTALHEEHAAGTLDTVIKSHLIRTLEKSRGRIEGPGGAAEQLGLNPSTLRGKLRKFKIPFGYHR